MRRRTAGWRNSFGGCVHCRGVVLRRRHRRTFHVDERMARCPRNRNSKILEREVTQIPPSARAKLPAKLPQQPPQDQDDLEHDRPSNLSVRVGQLCAWLLEHPPSQLGRQLPTRALDFVRFLQRSRALRAAGHKASSIVRSPFLAPRPLRPLCGQKASNRANAPRFDSPDGATATSGLLLVALGFLRLSARRAA